MNPDFYYRKSEHAIENALAHAQKLASDLEVMITFMEDHGISPQFWADRMVELKNRGADIDHIITQANEYRKFATGLAAFQ